MPVRAQLPDLVDLRAQYMPGVALEDPKPAEAQVSSYDVALNVPVPLANDFFLIPGFARFYRRCLQLSIVSVDEFRELRRAGSR